MIVIVANPSTSIMAGFAVFSVLGHLAHEAGVPIEDVTESGLLFIIEQRLKQQQKLF